MDTWWLCICEKADRLYIGITTDLENRLRQHGNPELLYREGPLTKTVAAKRERTLKGWSKKKKLELIGKASSQKE
jgi:predicted GIY-YIG superfamily endonuclease